MAKRYVAGIQEESTDKFSLFKLPSALLSNLPWSFELSSNTGWDGTGEGREGWWLRDAVQ